MRDLPTSLLSRIIQAAVLVLAGLWIYSPVINGSFLWDDERYLTKNPLLHDPAWLAKVWFQRGGLDEYYPLTATVQWTQYHLFGEVTTGYHLTNILLHISCAFLVWRLFQSLGLRFAWLGGLLFAVHPLAVESVAWIAELKNTLSLVFLLTSVECFLNDEEHGLYDPRHSSTAYWLTLSFFLAALLSKISVASFPLVILLYLWWKNGRLRTADLKATAPFFLLSILMSLVAFEMGLRDTNIPTITAATAPSGLFYVVTLINRTLAFFFWHSVWPVGLLPIYAPWKINPGDFTEYLPGLITLVLLTVCWLRRERGGRHVLLAAGWFLIFLIPALGLIVDRYPMLLWSFDHLGYISLIGVIGLAVAGLQKLDDFLPVTFRAGLFSLAIAVTVFLGLASHGYSSIFSDQKTLWVYTLERNPDIWRGLGPVKPERPHPF